MLRSVKPDDLPSLMDAPPDKFFTFNWRRRSGWEVGFREGNAWSNISAQKARRGFKTKALARDWAKTLAVSYGIPYAEGQRRREYTPAEIRAIRARSANDSVSRYDAEANDLESKDEYRKAASAWLMGSKCCEDYAALAPGSEAAAGRAAASRVVMAIRCLGRYRARLLAMRNGSSLREVPPSSEKQSTEAD